MNSISSKFYKYKAQYQERNVNFLLQVLVLTALVPWFFQLRVAGIFPCIMARQNRLLGYIALCPPVIFGCAFQTKTALWTWSSH